MEDAGIIELFFERSEQGIRELDIKYGKACRKLSYNIVNDRQDAEECVNDAYLGAWNAIPPVKPDPLLTYICKIVRNISLNLYHRKEAAKRSSHYTIATIILLFFYANFQKAKSIFIFLSKTVKIQKQIDRGYIDVQ